MGPTGAVSAAGNVSKEIIRRTFSPAFGFAAFIFATLMPGTTLLTILLYAIIKGKFEQNWTINRLIALQVLLPAIFIIFALYIIHKIFTLIQDILKNAIEDPQKASNIARVLLSFQPVDPHPIINVQKMPVDLPDDAVTPVGRQP